MTGLVIRDCLEFEKLTYRQHGEKGYKMKVLGKTLYILSLMFVLWVVISYVEISLENNKERPQYSKYHCFIITMEVLENENVND